MKDSYFLQTLIIDDEPQVSDFIGQVLELDGWNISKAQSAEQPCLCF